MGVMLTSTTLVHGSGQSALGSAGNNEWKKCRNCGQLHKHLGQLCMACDGIYQRNREKLKQYQALAKLKQKQPKKQRDQQQQVKRNRRQARLDRAATVEA